jgi:Zn-dependent M28 family amino/carboxypeptidase
MGQPMPTGVSYGLYSDHMPFSMRGIHTASLRDAATFKASAGTRGWGHTIADTEDKVDIRDMREAAVNLARLMLRLANADDIPFKLKSKDEIKQMLAHYCYDEVMGILKSYPSWLK